jgi:hypothetical protein
MDPVRGPIEYRDRKRRLWCLSLLLPVLPLLGIGLYLQAGAEWLLALPLLIAYTLIPLLDWLLGTDTNNPPEEDRYYRRLTYATVPLHFLTLVLVAWFVAGEGLSLVAVLLIHNVFAWFQLTSANYIEHYGLLREKLPDGRYERCQPHHSWNANYIFSNLVLFQLERHSDHHANSHRRYQSLCHFEDIPQLPNGYFGCYLLAYVPWLWYRVMDQRLLALPHIGGDMNRINLAPRQRARLLAKYAG